MSGTTANPNSDPLYFTTAITYTNGDPHVGHAFELITTDVFSRYHRVCGREVRFQTGTDEHGQKIAEKAEALDKTPKEVCDFYVDRIRKLVQVCDAKVDRFVRTTEAYHYEHAQWLFQQALEKDDIYLGEYEGWYNVKEEAFVTDLEAERTDYKCPSSGLPLQKMSEKSYFFRLTKYVKTLANYIQENPTFIQPEELRSKILKSLLDEENPITDLSISRTTFQWGIPCPNDTDHVMYVWFDALSNYLTGLRWKDNDQELRKFWNGAVHIIGKDITWFHCIIWPSMLLSCNIPLPKTVASHGFVMDKDGKKMSKSIGNTIDPFEIIEKYGSDTLRLYLCKLGVFKSDFNFSEDSLIDFHNADLCNTLGNLVNRAINLCKGTIPEAESDIVFDLDALTESVESKMNSFVLDQSANIIFAHCTIVNKYLTVKEPWKIKDNPVAKATAIRSTVESIYILAHFLQPFIPKGAAKIFEKLNMEPTTIKNLSSKFDNLKAGHQVKVGDILYQRVQTDEEKKAAMKKELEKKKAAEKKKDGKKGNNNNNNFVPGDPFTMIDMRVGKIVKAWPHPEADSLFCEEIDVGEDMPRQIASGLRAYYKQEDLVDRRIVVICNLKPTKLRGFLSAGMVLCAKTEDPESGEKKVEFVDVPAGAKVGERLFVQDLTGDLATPNQVKKLKAWEKTAEKLLADSNGIASYDNKPIMTSAGACTAPTLKNAILS